MFFSHLLRLIYQNSMKCVQFVELFHEELQIYSKVAKRRKSSNVFRLGLTAQLLCKYIGQCSEQQVNLLIYFMTKVHKGGGPRGMNEQMTVYNEGKHFQLDVAPCLTLVICHMSYTLKGTQSALQCSIIHTLTHTRADGGGFKLPIRSNQGFSSRTLRHNHEGSENQTCKSFWVLCPVVWFHLCPIHPYLNMSCSLVFKLSRVALSLILEFGFCLNCVCFVGLC